jgi:hypothetical protein
VGDWVAKFNRGEEVQLELTDAAQLISPIKERFTEHSFEENLETARDELVPLQIRFEQEAGRLTRMKKVRDFNGE